MFQTLAFAINDTKDFFLIAAVTGWIPVAIVAIIADACSKTARAKERERSRQEIAAYIAEGSMTPEQGERLLNAGRSKTKASSMWGCGSKDE